MTEAVALLRSLGHDVVERAPDYAAMSAGWNVTARYLRGISDDVATMPHPERLEPRTRSMARAGRLHLRRRIAKVRAREAALAARVNAIFDDADVVLTPGTATGPPRVGAFTKRGAFVTANATMGRSPFQAIFNATGQPAAVVPWDFDRTGVPTSIQLVGRPSDEATLLALSTQIEAARPGPTADPSSHNAIPSDRSVLAAPRESRPSGTSSRRHTGGEGPEHWGGRSDRLERSGPPRRVGAVLLRLRGPSPGGSRTVLLRSCAARPRST